MKSLSSCTILLSISLIKLIGRSTAFSSLRLESSSQNIGAAISTYATHRDFCADAIINASPTSNQDDTCSTIDIRLLSPDISARKWMEDTEELDGSLYGVGAYTVLRCDVSFSAANFLAKDDSNCNDNMLDIEWNIWGLDFHMNRLFSSYKMLLESQNQYAQSVDVVKCLEQEKDDTDKMIKSLLKEACEYISIMSKVSSSDTAKQRGLHRTLMLTVLWTPREQQTETKNNHLLIRPTIRGHATFAGPFRSSLENEMPSPISACLAVPDEVSLSALASLPSRYNKNNAVGDKQFLGPTAKISSWCRKRKPLEDPGKFKVPGMNVGEVFLANWFKKETTASTESFELLEGLTSNLFVIYKDGTVRTAPKSKVLPGYSRHLVLKALLSMQMHENNREIKLVLDERAPTVQDAIAGLWSEVFVTSAIRLLIPVNRVLKPSSAPDKATMTAIWQGDSFDQTVYIRNKEFQVGKDELSSYKLRIHK